MQTLKNGVSMLVLTLVLTFPGLAQAATTKAIPVRLPASGFLPAILSTRSVATGQITLEDTRDRTGQANRISAVSVELCACISLDDTTPVESRCNTASAVQPSTLSVQTSDTIDLIVSVLQATAMPATRENLAYFVSLMTTDQLPLMPAAIAEMRDPIPYPDDTATGLGGGAGGSHVKITAMPTDPFPTPHAAPRSTSLIPSVPLPAGSFLLLSGLAVMSLRHKRKARP